MTNRPLEGLKVAIHSGNNNETLRYSLEQVRDKIKGKYPNAKVVEEKDHDAFMMTPTITRYHLMDGNKELVTARYFEPYNRLDIETEDGLVLEACREVTILTKGNVRTETSKDYDEGCFIATAVYGNINAPEVNALRRFRDNTLVHNTAGRAFVDFYYSGAGKKAADIVKEHLPSTIPLLRKGLDLLVENIE